MSSEQPRNDQGQFAPAEASPQEPQGPATDPQRFVVSVDGEQREVTLDEALGGYMRQETFTRRSQELAERARMVEQQEAALRGGLQPGLGTGAPQLGAASGGLPPAYAPYEQPAYGTTAAQPPPPSAPPSYAGYDDLEDPVRRELTGVRGQMAQIQAQLMAERQERQRMQYEQAQEQQVSQLGSRYQGFNRAAMDGRFYMLPPHEQQYLANMPKAAAYELLHLRYGQSAGTPAPAGGTQAPAVAPGQGTAPPLEAGAARTQPTGQAPLEAPRDGNDLNALADMLEQAEQRGIRGVASVGRPDQRR